MVSVFMQSVGMRQILKWTELDIDLFYVRGTFLVKVLILMLHIKVHTIVPMWMLCRENSQVYCSILKSLKSTECVLMHYIPGMDKSSEILTANMEKKRRKNNKAKGGGEYGPKS